MRICQCGREIVGLPGKMYCGPTCRRRAAREREKANDPARRVIPVMSEKAVESAMYCATLDNPSVRIFVAARDVAMDTHETRPIRILHPSAGLVEAFDLVVDVDGHVSYFPND